MGIVIDDYCCGAENKAADSDVITIVERHFLAVSCLFALSPSYVLIRVLPGRCNTSSKKWYSSMLVRTHPNRFTNPSVQSIMEYNGGAMIAMVGKGCVAIASDRRFGIQAQTVDMNFKKIFRMTDRIYLGMTGLATDVQTLYEAMSINFGVESSDCFV